MKFKPAIITALLAFIPYFPAQAEGVRPEMIHISSGSFYMGSNNSPQEHPVHQVTIVHAFEIGNTAVTLGQWRSVMGNHDSSACGNDCTIDGVSWDDAKRFIKRLNKMTGKTYRLPTEAEWEYACRAGKQHGEYCVSADFDKPNAWGLYGLSGGTNVEWVEDYFHDNYNDAPTDGSAWSKPGSGKHGRDRVLRGGPLNSNPKFTSAATRTSGNRKDFFAFRLARTLP